MTRDFQLLGLCLRLPYHHPLRRDALPVLLVRVAGGPIANDVATRSPTLRRRVRGKGAPS